MATVESESTITEYRLTLSLEETATLITILQLIGGNPDTSIRMHADSIMFALREVTDEASNCLYTIYGSASDLAETRNRSIYFNDDSANNERFLALVEALK